MSVALIIAVVLVVILAIWQTIQLQAIRKKVDAVPEDGNVIAVLRSVDQRTAMNESTLNEFTARVEDLEGRLPYAISFVGVIAYDAFSNIVGNQSRSIAMLNQRGDGLVISLLTSRVDTVFFAKEVRSGSGVEELSPEEQAAVDRALGR